MNRIATRAVTTVLGAGALAVAASGVAHADERPAATDAAHQPEGTGSGLTGGPTTTWVLQDVEVPLADPTLGVGTLLPPVFNLLGGATG
ncbi:hypothetical protein [Pseudonocardia sp. T1-2H]|uniref:hypothetical protein n=1 Tax=Pseudonocardia sp. T1-2H TaxID=3128899 RepID=UPI003100AC8B